MFSDEPHFQRAATGGVEHEPATVARLPHHLGDSAGVTVPVPTEGPDPRGDANTSTKMRRKRGNARRTGHNLVVRGVRRDPPDIRKLAQVVASLAADMMEETDDEHSGVADTGASDTATAPAQRQPRRAA